MLKTILMMFVLISSSSVFARTYCIEQAKKIAESAYAESLKDVSQIGETQVSQIGRFNYEFKFIEGVKRGTKIKVKMIPQADPGTHCEISKLTSINY